MNESRFGSRRRQRGVAIGLVLVSVVLLAIVFFGIALMTNESGEEVTSSSKNKTGAATVRYQAALIETAFGVMIANGMTYREITFDSAPVSGLFHPANNAAKTSIPPLYVFEVQPKVERPQDPWKYVEGRLVLEGINRSTCEEINYSIRADSTIPTTGATFPQGEGCVYIGGLYTYRRPIP